MYAHCLFCNADLGRNEALEAFPVGRRLAYDAEKGRLWVVCGRCRRWNLTPLEERWEAIEQAERAFRATRVSASTDNVGLARLREGTELVRVGAPPRREIAAWRYSAELVRRQTAARVQRGAFYAVWIGIAGVAVAIGGPFAALQLAADLGSTVDGPARPRRVPPLRARVRVAGHLVHTEIAPTDARIVAAPDGRIDVSVPWGRERRVLAGADAYRVAGGLMRYVNAEGAGAREVDFAIQRLARARDVNDVLTSVAERTTVGVRRRRASEADDTARGLLALSRTDALAFEMVLHDELERRALDGALAELERAWRDAEEIAAIADGLALPRPVEAAWERLRARVRPLG